MNRQRNTFNPDWVISPGETLQEWLDENRLPIRALATACGLEPRDVEGVLQRKRLTLRIAEGLERGTMIPTRLWVNLERAYRDGLAAGKKDTSRT